MAKRVRPDDVTIRTRFVGWVLQYVRAFGGDADAIGARFGVSPDASENEPIAWTLLRDVSEAAEAALGDPFVGLHMAQVNVRGSYGVLEFSARTAPNTRQGVERLVRYQSLVTDRTRFALRTEGDRAFIEHRIVGLPSGCGRHPNEFTVAILVRHLREILGAGFQPSELFFSHERPPRIDALLEFFGTDRLTFAHDCNAVAFPDALLEAPMPTADPALLKVLDEYATTLVERAPGPKDDFVGVVKDEIQRELMNGTPDIERVAEHLRVSSRTLQRRLGELETSFHDLVEGTRHELAVQHLAKPSLGVAEVAYLLGYSDTRAFLRAFKRWTGMTPTEHRKKAGAPNLRN